ncbi:MAG: hypothetical protein ACREXI_03965, partial [Caldimonas sp.]
GFDRSKGHFEARAPQRAEGARSPFDRAAAPARFEPARPSGFVPRKGAPAGKGGFKPQRPRPTGYTR